MAQSKSQLKRRAIQHGIYIEAYTVVTENMHREVMNALCEVLKSARGES